ncbi:hypothetical protein T069G_07541 [Trichoderma breve]|uniref:HD/PDEase domain-containing protein n=1 Tax=Trichoderma breve TaxID=2034170 RepID=A0A9W9BB84_9HYPO|nr:hypothetical protein T069G_07541 [Trichoderma breve]KAJ4859274.1 hypothetical protein T069G_07541 [Trichoderma breve]
MSSPLTVDPALIAKVTDYIKVYMANYDPSHDYSHIKRVVHLAQTIQAQVPNTNRDIVTLAALMHDVGDRKYLKPGEDASRMIYTALTSLGASEELAEKIQVICLGVSYSSEIKDLARDADRLDAIGAVGIGRVFTFGGAKGRDLGNSIDHFEEKLLKLETMMKTDVGREMARERTERLRLMQEWWQQETEGVEAKKDTTEVLSRGLSDSSSDGSTGNMINPSIQRYGSSGYAPHEHLIISSIYSEFSSEVNAYNYASSMDTSNGQTTHPDAVAATASTSPAQHPHD